MTAAPAPTAPAEAHELGPKCTDCDHEDQQHSGAKFVGCCAGGCPCPRPPRHARTNWKDEVMRETCPDCGAPLFDGHEICRVCAWFKPSRRRVSSKRSREDIVKSIESRFQLRFHVDLQVASDFLYAVRLRTVKLPKGISFRDDGSAQHALLDAIDSLDSTDSLEQEIRRWKNIVAGTDDPDERDKREIDERSTDSPTERAKKRATGLARAEATLQERQRAHRHLVTVMLLGRTTCDAPGPHGARCHEKAGHLHAEHYGPAPDLPREPSASGLGFPTYISWTTCTFPLGGCCRKHKTGGPDECLSWAVFNGRATPPASASAGGAVAA